MAGKSLIDGDFMDEGDEVVTPVADDDYVFPEPQEVQKPRAKEKADKPSIEIDVVSDAPDKDRGKWVADDDRDGPPDIPDEEEIKQYSQDVQKRIGKMTARMHAERRAAEERAREAQEALTLAQRLLAENNQLKSIVENGEKVLLGEHKGRLEGQLAQARAAFREAQEAGDTNGIIAAQEQLARVVSQMDRLSTHRPQTLPREDESILKPAPQQPQAPKPDPKAVEWQERNRWFGRDEAMTAYAMGLHAQIVGREGIRPDEDEYYERINGEMQKRFPERFKQPQRAPQKTGSVVAPASRNGRGVAPRKVSLTESQARLARRLGLTLEQYAEQLLVEQDNGNGKEFTHSS